MKKIFLLLIFSFFISLTISCNDEQKQFNVPTLTGRVVDTAKVLSKEEKEKIESVILNFEKNTKGGQFAVCIIPSLCNETIESASIKIAEKWKIGNKNKDDGIIFVLTMKEREFRIEVGYGYEGKINDAKAGKIGRLAASKFKQKNWSQGIIIIINECSNIISGNKSQQISENKDEKSIPNWVIFVILIVIVIFVFSGLLGNIDDGDDDISFFGGGSSSGGGSSFGGGGGSFGGGGFSGKF